MHRILVALRPARWAAPRCFASSASTDSSEASKASHSPKSPTAPEGAAGPAPGVVPATSEDAPGACGWFDSSHALQHGLHVTEHASADAVAAELPLADWLQLHLSGWSAVPDGQARLSPASLAR